MTRGEKITSGRQVGRMALQPLPLEGSPTLESLQQNQKWPTSLPGGCIPLSLGGRGVTNASHMEDKIRTSPQVGRVATGPLQPVGSRTLHPGGQNKKWPTSGPGGYTTPAARGVPGALEGGQKSEVAHK